MALDNTVIRLLELKTGYPVDTPSGAEQLTVAIEKETGRMISLNTVKRLTGVLEYDGQPRQYTLDLIARFLGFESWRRLDEYIRSGSSAFNASGILTEISHLPPGTIIDTSWAPDRLVRLEHMGEARCRVIESHNSKLTAGDIATIRQIAAGFPLLAESVLRDGVNLGQYTAATETGLTNITIRRNG